MRAIPILAVLLLAACAERETQRQAAVAPSSDAPKLTSGEERARIAPQGEAAAIVRSGPEVPVSLPGGFTLYPGASVVSNTVVDRGGQRRVLLVIETPDPVEKVILHYRAEAHAAGMVVEVDLGGSERASFGGMLPSGGEVAISARRERGITRAEFAQF